MKQETIENLQDFALACVIAGALLIGALAYFDILIK